MDDINIPIISAIYNFKIINAFIILKLYMADIIGIFISSIFNILIF
jgi:hypothetical protein